MLVSANGKSMMLQRLDQLPLGSIEGLAALARAEGYRFLDRLIDEWRRDLARFDRAGEKLIGAFVADRLVGVGGLHRDPYANAGRVARLRRFYVAPDQRRTGVAGRILSILIEGARGHFDVVRLRAPDERAGLFYVSQGFVRIHAADATHELPLV